VAVEIDGVGTLWNPVASTVSPAVKGR